MTRWSGFLAVALLAVTPLRAAAAPVTWEVEGTLQLIQPSLNSEGVPIPLPPNLSSLGIVVGALATGTFTMSDEAVPEVGLPGQTRYGNAVTCGLSVGSVSIVCGSAVGSLAVLDPPHSLILGGRSGDGFVTLDLELKDGVPLPGPDFPFALPAFGDLAPYGAGTEFGSLNGGGIIADLRFELTSIRQVPEPSLAWVVLALPGAWLLRSRR